MKLATVAKVNLGFKSLLNDFFYVDISRIETFGIEEEFLVPIYKLSDLDDDAYWQSPSPTRWVFVCKSEWNDLRGSGAERYIRWAESQETRRRKQSKSVTTWSRSPALQGNNRKWYHPAAPLHEARLAVRKGIGKRYAPFAFGSPVVLDQRLYLIEPKTIPEQLLLAYLSSGLHALSLETDADLGLGGGVLTLGADNLRALPVPDLRLVAERGAGDVVAAFEELAKTSPPDVGEMALVPQQVALDRALLAALGQPESRVEELHRELFLLAQSRLRLSGGRRAHLKKAEGADIARVSAPLIQALEKWLRARRLPEDFIPKNAPTEEFAFPNVTLQITVSLLLAACTIEVRSASSEQVVYSGTMAKERAELLVRCLQLGRRSFALPQESVDCIPTLEALEGFLESFEEEFVAVLATTPIGPRYQEEIHDVVLRALNIPLAALRSTFDSGSLTAALAGS